jgi:hypothetical protein
MPNSSWGRLFRHSHEASPEYYQHQVAQQVRNMQVEARLTNINESDVQRIYAHYTPSAWTVIDDGTNSTTNEGATEVEEEDRNTYIKRREVEELVGIVSGNLTQIDYLHVTLSPRKTGMLIWGYEMEGRSNLALITKRQITASKKRAEHLKDQLEELASREGLPIVWRDAVKSPTRGSRIIYWPWKNVAISDDSPHIITRTTRAANTIIYDYD